MRRAREEQKRSALLRFSSLRPIASLLPRTLLIREEPVRRFHLLADLRVAPG